MIELDFLLKIPLSSLKFNELRSTIKLIKLAQHRYNPDTNMLTITTDRYIFNNKDFFFSKKNIQN